MFDLLNIRKNILLLIITPSLIGTIILSIYFAIDKLNTAELNLKQQASLFASNVEMIIGANSFENKRLIEKQLTQFNTTNSHLLAFGILDQNNQLLVKSGDVYSDNLKRTRFPTELVSKTINQHLYIYVPIKLTKLTSPSNLNSYYLSLVFDRSFLQLLLYQSLLFSVLILIVVLTICFIVASHISKKINKLNNSLSLAKKNMQTNIDQATFELTQTLETIEVQNIEIDCARKHAIKINQVKSEFLANISHEIRTPMNGVIGFTNLLLKSNIDEIQSDYLITIRKSANQLLNIIEDILDFSKIEAGKMNLDSVLFSFHDCIEEVITLLSIHSMKKQIELVPLIYKNVPDVMLGDPTRVKQVLTNLISNAIKFTEKGSVVVRVIVEESTAGNYLIRTTITDTGMGMTDEQISKLFQPFSQVNQKINRHHSGTGLGLVISKKLIEKMEGTISIESKSNEGTSFSFTFRSQKPSEQCATLPTDLTPKFNDSEQQVYLYDYHPMALLAMKQLLLSWSMTVSTFQNIDKLIRTVQLLTTEPEPEPEPEHENSKPIIIIGLPNENNDIVNKIQDIFKMQNSDSNIAGILFIGPLEHRNRSETLMQESLLHYLEKPLTRKQLKNSFKQMGLFSNEQQAAIKLEPIVQVFSGLRILVVDDNCDNLKLITIVLEEMQIDVIQAYDGLSAIELCKDEHFDLIFMDIRMPGIDGVESSKRIHSDSLNSSTPIIALTAHAMSGEKEQLLKSGLQDFMTKPISSVRLKQLISQWTTPKCITNSCCQLDSIDWGKALEITAGREDIALELLEVLYVKMPEFKRQLNSVSIDSIAELLSNTHKFLGLTCYTGVPKLQQLTRTLEQQINNKQSFTEIKQSIALLLTEMGKVEQAAIHYMTKEDCSLN